MRLTDTGKSKKREYMGYTSGNVAGCIFAYAEYCMGCGREGVGHDTMLMKWIDGKP